MSGQVALCVIISGMVIGRPHPFDRSLRRKEAFGHSLSHKTGVPAGRSALIATTARTRAESSSTQNTGRCNGMRFIFHTRTSLTYYSHQYSTKHYSSFSGTGEYERRMRLLNGISDEHLVQ